jgi:hypothetical protein
MKPPDRLKPKFCAQLKLARLLPGNACHFAKIRVAEIAIGKPESRHVEHIEGFRPEF